MPDDDDKRTSKNDSSTNANLCQSIVIFISARALGHVGFALSLFAVWLTWLLPPVVTEPPVQPEIKKPGRRHPKSAHAHQLLHYKVQAAAPVDLSPILATRSVDTQHARHVYFADEQGASTLRDILPEPPAQPILIPESTPASSPRPSVSTLSEEIDSTAHDSDYSRTSQRACSRGSSRLHKFKLGFAKARSDSLDTTDQNSITSEEPHTSSYRITFRRSSSPARSDSSITAPSASAADILSPAFFTRKKQKRVSAPIPRTMPYGPPYFATPPILLDTSYSNHLRKLPQFRNEVNTSPPVHDSDSEPMQSRGIRRVSLDVPPCDKRSCRAFRPP